MLKLLRTVAMLPPAFAADTKKEGIAALLKKAI